MDAKRWFLTAALAATGAGAAVAFAGSSPGTCTLVGADPGVLVRSDDGSPLTPHWGVLVEHDGDSGEAWPVGGDVRFASVDLPDQDQATLLVTITDAAGSVITQDSVTVDTEPYLPNGRDCAPTVGRAHLAISPDGEVMQSSGPATDSTAAPRMSVGMTTSE